MGAVAGSDGSELRRGLPLVLACGFGFGLGLSGIPFYTFGVFVDPLRAAFGWSVSAIQAGLTVSYLTTVATLPGVAWAADRFGAKRVAWVSSGLFGLAFMALGLTGRQLWGFYAHWFLVSLFGTGTLALTWSRGIAGSFQAGRGLALGLALLGSGVMGVIGPPLARMLIGALGWRSAYACLGLAPILVSIPLTLAFFHEGATPQSSVASRGIKPPLLSQSFWLAAGAFLVIGMGVAGVIPNLVKVFTTSGLGRDAAITATSVVGLFVVIGRVACGALIDRFWAPGVAAVFMAAAALACLLLSHPPISYPVALAAGAMIGLVAGAEFDLLPFLVGRYFPLGAFTRSLGAVSAVFYVGAAAGGPLLGRVYDASGRYGPGLDGAAALFILGGVGLLCLGRYPVFPTQQAESR